MPLSVAILMTAVVGAGLAWLAPAQEPAAAADPPAGFHGVTPARILDTRPSSPTVDGEASGGGPVGPGVTVLVEWLAGLPATRHVSLLGA